MIKTIFSGQSGTLPQRAARASRPVDLPAELDRWVDDFDRHLSQVVGLAPATRLRYSFFVRRFLADHRGAGLPDRCVLRAEWLTAFVRQEAARVHGHSRKHAGTAMRAWLRYLVFRGMADAGLEAAIPSMPQWKHASLPAHLTVEQTERVIGTAWDGSPHELRDHAILLMLARIGLRACEATHLTFEDIDWAEGYVRIGPGKSHRERLLPLPCDVGEALYAYLQRERPASLCRTVFLSTKKPYGPIRDTSVISSTVRRAMARSGVVGIAGAAHALRHTAATQMVREGASFKDVADVLGHASLATTAIYAKLDVARLVQVALPWPGARS
ncbi:site-specific integrase [Paraburkholderia lacunae]|uniref:Integrase n=1 Tax=Paraburkholderia lacunae TaxID=2211104 RepID=A0A370MZY3_9BURK|nr:site-specific integrase [Paraburkholderia lacunae]RDJ98935.1 hypothetical protein DLM46_31420 [Paraburkholderia lacunae]